MSESGYVNQDDTWVLPVCDRRYGVSEHRKTDQIVVRELSDVVTYVELPFGVIIFGRTRGEPPLYGHIWKKNDEQYSLDDLFSVNLQKLSHLPGELWVYSEELSQLPDDIQDRLRFSENEEEFRMANSVLRLEFQELGRRGDWGDPDGT